MLDFLFRATSAFTEADSARIRRIEKKLDMILEELNLTFEDKPDELPEAVKSLLARGEKIGAIAEHRRLLGTGLAEAKQAVERYQASISKPPA